VNFGALLPEMFTEHLDNLLFVLRCWRVAVGNQKLVTLRVTPAMEAGLADHIWTLEELVTLLEPKGLSAAA
jgi:hypothetical protein